MTGGTLTLNYTDDEGTRRSLDIDIVDTLQESLQKSCTIVPLVSQPIADTFAVDTKSLKVINISFKRNQPTSGMSNAAWLDRVEQALNRWQCKSDGFSLVYEPDADNPYIAEINENGYVKQFSYQISAGQNTIVKGNIEFHVGTMYVQTTPENPKIRDSEFSVRITDSLGSIPYTILGGGINCIESYKLCGGPESPFEYAQIVVPRNRLASVAPALVEEGGIVAGRNRVEINAIGRSNMTVTKCKMSNNRYTITAYCNADRLRGTMLFMDEYDTPEGIIRHILNNAEGRYGVSFSEEAGTLIMHYTPSNIGLLKFSAGKNVWYVLQVCAMCLGCRIFFADNKAYVIDMRLEGGSDMIQSAGTINLYDPNGNLSTVGTVSLGDEGLDTVINQLNVRATISATDENGNVIEGTVVGLIDPPCQDEKSVKMFDGRSGGTIFVDELTQLTEIPGEPVEDEGGEEGEEPVEPEPIQEATNQARTFGNNYISYRSEPQQSIEFTAREMYMDNVGAFWSPQYIPAARANKIIDDIDNVVISNESDLPNEEPKLQKLCLSTYERHYPQGTSTYIWGVMASIDLSSSTSQIVSTLNNG